MRNKTRCDVGGGLCPSRNKKSERTGDSCVVGGERYNNDRGRGGVMGG